MKPRNARERKFLSLVPKLPPVTSAQTAWAYDHCFEPLALYRRRGRRIKCLCCGYETAWDRPFFESYLDVDEYDCPECGKSLRMDEYTTTTSCNESKYFAVITTFRGYQLARVFDVCRSNRRDVATSYHIDEIFQIWIDADGTETITGRRLHRGINYISWDFHLPWGIAHHNRSANGYYQFDDVYDLTGCYLYPDMRVTPILRRNGWSKDLAKYARFYSLTDAMRRLLTSPVAEMLVKNRQFELFLYMMRNSDPSVPFLHSARVANRHHYIISDASMWIDMLNMAEDLHLDTHNPSVVCPEILAEAHDRILHRHTRLLKKINHEKRIQEAIAAEDRYSRNKGRYFGICFGDERVSIAVIRSVAAMAEEGAAMHHCVFDSKYYDKPESLILSARDPEGNRLETVEVSLKSFKVIQSRAKFNNCSPLHDHIVSLVNSNMDLIKNVS